MNLLDLAFMLSALVVGYTYVGYPLLIHLLAKLRPMIIAGQSTTEPRVTVVIPCLNALKYIPAKLDSLRQQSYPAEKLQVVIVSDGSTDGSDEFLAKQPNLIFLRVDERSGKPTALSLARKHLPPSDIVVLTDIRQPMSENAVADLVNALADPKVGVAGGELEQRQPDGSEAPIGLYWRYEKAIRRSESAFFSTVGASGALYAIREPDFVDLPGDTILDDFDLPLRTLRRGQRTVFVDGAKVLDFAEPKISGEWPRKVRTLSGNFQSLKRNLWLLSPRRNPAFLQYFSHKFLRLVAPWALIAMLILSLLSPTPGLRILAMAQGLFYLTALAALIWPGPFKTIKPAGVAATFVALNAAAVVALFKSLSGRSTVTWKQSDPTKRG